MAEDPIAAIAIVRAQTRDWVEPYRSALATVCRAASRAYAAEKAAAELERELGEARQALERRKIVERGKGLVMQQRKVSEPDAYRLLQCTAMLHGRPLWDVAAAVVARPEIAHALVSEGERR